MGAASKLSMLLTTPFPLLCSRPSLLRLARHSRVSISSSSFQKRSKFPLNPRYRLGFSTKASEELHTQSTSVTRDGNSPETLVGLSSSRGSHPWPEWLKLVESLEASGYFNGLPISSELHMEEDAFQMFDELPDEFVRAANACLSFARERPELLRLLSKRDIEIVVENGSPFMFQSAVDTARRMRSFLSKDQGNELESGGAGTVDLMRFLLSYTHNLPDTPGHINLNNRDLIELSVRNILRELGDASRRLRESTIFGSLPKQVLDTYAQTPRPSGRNIEMKRGDWICPMCSFMNFAKNVKCLECNEARPKRLLTGGEWECPQCEFYNYGKNVVCLRCDCKRLGAATAGPRSGLGYSDGTNLNMDDTANDIQADRWFSKASQVDNTSELNGSSDNESEIMPLRKGVNRFVVGTRKTPLERSLLQDQFQENLGSDGSSKPNDLQAGGGMGSAKTSDTSISESMDRLLGHSSSATELNSGTAGSESKRVTGKTSISNTASPTLNRSKVSNSDVRFVPLPADMFAKPQKPKKEEQLTNNHKADATKADEVMGSSITSKSDDTSLLSERPVKQSECKEDKEQAEISERWFKKVAELHDVTDLASAISDEDFPEIMPMRKGENRFVVSKKKDRSLTSPQYKRRMAMEQGSNTNFVPFVPFPPDYFAKKDKPSETEASTGDARDRTRTPASSTTPEIQGSAPEKGEERSSRFPNYGAVADSVQRLENQQGSKDHRNTSLSGKSLNESKLGGVYEGREGNSNLRPSGTWRESTRSDTPSSTHQNSTQGKPENSQNSGVGKERGFSGKSLEGSLVKEPDPLDMSEEAKAERWFRRAAQIKDISELSQIPDEDFPEIMPMRKGVNRFVVSKRKTPLERRLTSPQYRRNLPTVSSEPLKKENDTS